MAFLDLMAYAKGAELANRANWQDVLNDVNVRNTEQQMQRAQTTYDLNLPTAQLRAEEDVLDRMGAASHSAFEAQTVSALSKLPPEQQASFLADQIGSRLRTIDPSSPAGAAELKQTENFALMRAEQLRGAGDYAGAQALLRTIPGAGAAQADRTANILKWSNPAGVTAEDITAAGGEILPNGRVKYGLMGEMDPMQFIQIQRSLALDPSQNLAASGERLQQIDRAREGAVDLTAKFAQRGIATWTNPNTFTVHPIDPNGVPNTAVNLNPQASAPTPQQIEAQVGRGAGTQTATTAAAPAAAPVVAAPTVVAPAAAAPPAPPAMLDARTINPAWQAWNAQFGQQPRAGLTALEVLNQLYTSGTPGQVNAQYANTAAQWQNDPRLAQPQTQSPWLTGGSR